MPATEAESVMQTFERLREREKQRFRDARKGKIPIMDAETLRELCVDNDGYETPELNDNLYAHFQGFQKIEGLEPYYNLKALWLESNGLTRLENLSPLVNLRCLYLSKNLIETVENLECLKELNTLDLSENRIKSVNGIGCLARLSSLNLSRNLIVSSDDLGELSKCTELSNVDVSHNRIDDIGVIDVFKSISKLRALRITGNEVVSKTKYFRKVYISTMPHLSFLDRPIFAVERAGVEAWAKGGNDAELAAKRAFVNKEHEDRRRDLQSFRDWQAQVRERRLREIAEEQTRKKEEQELKPETPTEPELREEDVDLRGFRGITKQEYMKLSAEERAVWDERIQAAHEDSVRGRHEVMSEGVGKMGTKFWAEEAQRQIDSAGTKESVPTRGAVPPEPVSPQSSPTLVSAHITPPPAPVTARLQHSVAISPLAETEHSAKASECLVDASTISTASSETRDMAQHASEDTAAPNSALESSPRSSEPAVFQRDANFFSELGDTRRSWAELEQRAREAPFLHRPTQLPSVKDESDDDENGDVDDASATRFDAGFPIRALTRDEILREIASHAATPSSSPPSGQVMPPPAPVVAVSRATAGTATGFTNVSALD